MRHKATITATDNIGRTESITLILEDDLIQRLRAWETYQLNAGETINDLRHELWYTIDTSKSAIHHGYIQDLTASQTKRLTYFMEAIHNRFFSYTLHIDSVIL